MAEARTVTVGSEAQCILAFHVAKVLEVNFINQVGADHLAVAHLQSLFGGEGAVGLFGQRKSG